MLSYDIVQWSGARPLFWQPHPLSPTSRKTSLKEREASDTAKALCPACGKRISPNRRPGSFTSYLFSAFDCACSRAGALGQGQPASQNPDQGEDNDFCPKCGLRIASNSKEGSLTGFLFQDTRCKCLPDQAFAEGKMSDRFWKLKRAGTGTIFISSSAQEERPNQLEAPSIDLAPGAIIGGAYKIIKLIGRGGMGEVYLARHETLGKDCALKVIPPEQVSEIGWQRFQLEAKAVAKLDHINLVRVTDLGIHDGCLPFYAMDYVEGKDLSQVLTESGPMPLQAVLDIFMQVCDGVDCAHRSGILHRDLKPANIMVVPLKSGKWQAKVLDFGLAKLMHHDRSKQSLTQVGDVFGSPSYMSPEQCNGEKPDRRSDVYSVGCTIFECLTGQPPFSGKLAAAIIYRQVEDDPPSLESIVGKGKFPTSMEIVMAKLLRKNPVERYQTLLELRGDLEKLASGEDVQPFYVSRSQGLQTKAIQAGAATAGRERSDRPAKTPFSLPGAPARTMALIMFVLVGFVAFAFLGYWRNSAKPTQISNTLSAIAGLAPRHLTQPATQTASPSERDSRPYSKIVEENGHKWRVFNFPEDTIIGEMIVEGEHGAHATVQPARGMLKFPVETLLHFKAYPIAVRYPSYLRRFAPGDVFEVIVDVSPSATNESGEFNVNEYLQAISVVPGVKSLRLQNDLRDLTTDGLASIDKLHSLKQILASNALNTGILTQLSSLKQLETLWWKVKGDATAVVKSLKDLTLMKRLRLFDAKVTLDEIGDLARLPKLETLHFDQVIPSDDASTIKALNLLSQAPHLRMLSVRQLPLTPDAITELKSFKNLEELRIDKGRSGVTDEDVLQLKSAAEHVGLTTRLVF